MLAAIGAARAEDAVCQGPARIDAEGAAPAPRTRVENYRPVFEQCRNGAGATRLAIRRFSVDGSNLMLTVDPATLATSLEHAQCWTCAETDEAAQKDDAIHPRGGTPSQHAISSAKEPDVMFNAGLSHGQGEGSFITGDLCPSRRPLDRAFLEKLETLGPRYARRALDIRALAHAALRRFPMAATCRPALARWRSPGSTIPTITPISPAVRPTRQLSC